MRELFITENVNEDRIIKSAIESAEKGTETTVHYHIADREPCNEKCKIYMLAEDEEEES